MKKLITLLIIIESCSALDSSAAEYNCSIIPTKNINLTNSTCCDLPFLMSEDIQDQANKELNLYFNSNQNINRTDERNHNLVGCLFNKFMMESVGTVVNDQFHLDKFNAFIKNNPELVHKFSIYADDEFVKFGEKCLKLADEIDVKGKQEHILGVKVKHCDETLDFIWKCYSRHVVAVSIGIPLL